MKKCEIIQDAGFIKIWFGGSDFHSAKDIVKSLPGRKYHPDFKYWSAPHKEESEEILRSAGFDFGDGISMPEEDYTIDESWRGYSFDLPEIEPGYNFYEHQKEAIQYLEFRKGNAYLGLDMGSGKSLISLSYIMNDPEDRLPALIVVPSPVKPGFKKDFHKFYGDSVDVEILQGMDSIRKYTEKKIYIVNYEILSLNVETLEVPYTAKGGKKKVRKVNAPSKQLAKFASSKFSTLVLDEAHRIKNVEAKIIEAIREIAVPVKYIIGMSGTPILSRPSEVWSTMNLVSPDEFPKNRYYAFLNKYCDPKSFVVRDKRITTYNGCTNSKELHAMLRNNGMLVFDNYKDVAEIERIVMPMELDNIDSYMDEANMVKMEIAKNPALALTQFEKLKQAAVRHKMAQVQSFINYTLEVEDKIVVFATHRKVIEQLNKKYSKISTTYNGALTPAQKEANKEKFINDPKCKILFASIQAAGTGVDGLQYAKGCKTMVFIELDWTREIHRQAEARLARTGFWADHLNIYYLVAENTIENEIIDKLDFKATTFEAVIKGEEINSDDLLNELKSRYISEGKKLAKIHKGNKED